MKRAQIALEALRGLTREHIAELTRDEQIELSALSSLTSGLAWLAINKIPIPRVVGTDEEESE